VSRDRPHQRCIGKVDAGDAVGCGTGHMQILT
jgi:hypothetical protein